MTLTNAQWDAIEALGWSIHECEDDYELEAYSDAGEDIIVSLPKDEEPVSYLYDYWQDFNPDEHAANWYGQGRGEPSSLRVLLDDAECIENMYRELYECLRDAKAPKRKSGSKCTKPYAKSKTVAKKAPVKKRC